MVYPYREDLLIEKERKEERQIQEVVYWLEKNGSIVPSTGTVQEVVCSH
jgi:hypothetical protein